MAVDLHRDHRLGLSLVGPEQLADNPDLRIGDTVLIVADVLDHHPVRAEAAVVGWLTEQPGLPGVKSRPLRYTRNEAFRIEFQPMRPAVPQILPGGKLLRIRG